MRGPKSKTNETEDREMDDAGDTSVDLFEMLKTDHRSVQDLFTRFENTDKRSRSSIAQEVLMALEIHTTLEEELVYPAIREVIEQEESIDEALEEHHVAKLLIKELHKMDAGDEAFAAKFKVLGEIVGHHIEEEEGEMFPQAEEGGLETGELGKDVTKLKQKLMQKHKSGEKKSSGQRRKKAA